jgi:WD40 repeat protein
MVVLVRHDWNVATGSEVRKLVGHTGSVLPVAFSLDGHRIASGSNDGYVIIWAVLGVTIFRLRRKQGMEHVAFSAGCVAYGSRGEPAEPLLHANLCM